MGLGIPHGSSIVVLRDQLHTDTSIDAKRIIITEITDSGFGRLFSDSLPLSSISEQDSIYCIESPQKVEDSAEIVLCIFAPPSDSSSVSSLVAIFTNGGPARKTFASTILLYNDVPMEIVSELLGHSNMIITQESYGKVVQKKVSQEMSKLSQKLKVI